jgi:SIR2-like domain
MSSSDDIAINTIAEHIKKGECILFLGAGVHYPPPAGSTYSYPVKDRPPLGVALSNLLATKCNLVANYPKEAGNVDNLQRVSMFHEKDLSRNKLVQEVQDAVGGSKRPSPAVRGLASLSFPLIITTNYDQLFEQALRDAGKNPRVSVYDEKGETPTADYQEFSIERPFVFKIHGDIDKPNSIVITDEDYIQFVLRMSDKEPTHPVPLTFRFYFTRWPTLFIGYSLMDYNLRLLFKTLRWKVDPAIRPDTYSVDLSPDPLILDVWQNQRRYVKFIVQNVWDFVPKIYQRVTGKKMPN